MDDPPLADAGDQLDDIFALEVTTLSAPDLALGRKPTHRVIHLLATALLVTSVIALLLAAQVDVRAALLSLWSPTAMRPALTDGRQELVYLEESVPWGTLQIDGRHVPMLSTTFDPAITDSLTLATRGLLIHHLSFPAFFLSAGHHTLDYATSGLFPVVHCHISVPLAASDDCPVAPPPPPAWGLSNPRIRLLAMGATAERLPPAQQQALIEAAQNALATSDLPAQVDQGMRLLTAAGHVSTAATALWASLVTTLNRDPRDGLLHMATDCITLCAASPFTSLGATAWALNAHVLATWRYQSMDDPSISFAGAAGPDPNDQDVSVPLAVTWHDGWRVSVPTEPALVCLVAWRAVGRLLASASSGLASSVNWNAYSWVSTHPPHATDGCLLKGRVSARRLGTPSAGPSALAPVLFYRFGILLAANVDSQQLFPHLPTAEPGESTPTPAWGPSTPVDNLSN